MKKLTFITAILLTANMLFGQYKIDTSFYSEALGEEKMVDIYFPPGYDENPNLYYPVIYYLHAWGGDQNTMNTMTSWLTYLINDSIIDPVIMVGADNSPLPFGGNMYVNSELWGNYEDYMVGDLVSWVDSSFRTIPERDGRALLGHSMGSYGSFRYGILHKDKFKALAAHAGIVTFDIDLWLEPARQKVILENPSGPPYFYNYSLGSFTGGAFLLSGAFSPDTNSPQNYINPQVVNYLFDENADYIDSVLIKWQAYDIMQLTKQLSQADSVGIYFGCGTNDDFILYPAHLALKDTLAALGLPYEFYSHDGGHAMPGGFKEGALIFLDSLLLPPAPYISGIDPVAQEKRLSNLLNYPNPFPYSTTIQYELSEKGYVELIIWNHLGQEVETLFKGNKQAGQHQILFNALKLPAGIYFCRLHSGNEIVTKKIIKR